MGKQWKRCQGFFGGGSKITAEDDCNYEIKGRLLLGRKVMTNLNSIFKSREIILPTKFHLVKATVFPGGRGGRRTREGTEVQGAEDLIDVSSDGGGRASG